MILRLLALVLMLLAGCTRNPATGRDQLLLLSRSQEIAIGKKARASLLEQYGGAHPATTLQDYVSVVGERVAAVTEERYRDLPWSFTILFSEELNAFALPGGMVFVTTGLLERLEDEAQLAAVLGHEIGHTTAQHIDERISHGFVLDMAGRLVLDSDTATVTARIVGIAGQGYLLRFSRDQELEADRQGLRYMSRSGYVPVATAEVLEILLDASEDRRATFLSTHPHPRTRLHRIEEQLEMLDRHAGERLQAQFEQRVLPHLEVDDEPDEPGA